MMQIALGHRKATPNWGSVTVPCPSCGVGTHITVNRAAFRKWQAGELIQDAMPYLSVDERETLITGLCTPCSDIVYEEEE